MFLLTEEVFRSHNPAYRWVHLNMRPPVAAPYCSLKQTVLTIKTMIVFNCSKPFKSSSFKSHYESQMRGSHDRRLLDGQLEDASADEYRLIGPPSITFETVVAPEIKQARLFIISEVLRRAVTNAPPPGASSCFDQLPPSKWRNLPKRFCVQTPSRREIRWEYRGGPKLLNINLVSDVFA